MSRRDYAYISHVAADAANMPSVLYQCCSSIGNVIMQYNHPLSRIFHRKNLGSWPKHMHGTPYGYAALFLDINTTVTLISVHSLNTQLAEILWTFNSINLYDR